MAKKRMFSTDITDSDAFCEMPLSSQALYFHLGMQADDEGFINNQNKIKRTVGSSEDDMKLLIMKKFIIVFDTGICVVKHWKVNNTLRSDRKKETNYLMEKSMLFEEKNGSYSPKNKDAVRSDFVIDTSWYTNCLPNGCIDKVSIVEDSLDKFSVGEETDAAPSPPSLFETFESEFARPISSIEIDLIYQWEKEYNAEIIRLALTEAVKNGARNFRYIEVVLNSWKMAGVRNADEAKLQIEARNSKKQPGQQFAEKKELPKWYYDQDSVKTNDEPVDEAELERLMKQMEASK